MSVFHPEQGDIVFLVTERRSERTGRLHEIGTRARVVGARSGLLTLEIDGLPPRDSLVCTREDVSHVMSPRPRQATGWYRRRGAFSAAY